ncbi:unnamed protein product [Phytomonas sp. Hart1]|nr:unnamed protein product [Phytomonas sp. Hart1]|eukprot:CCW70954.1 unnamed protein product [Phytomonas sp. isolate Hart1]
MHAGNFLSNKTNANYVPGRKKTQNSTTPNLPIRTDLTLVQEYSPDICNYFLQVEQELYHDRMYMTWQPEITEKMRRVLIDWLTDVNIEFKNHSETFFLAVDIIDRFLSKREISRGKLQLVGIAAMLISAKHEEVWPPSVRECVVVTASTYSESELIKMECEIACELGFRFTVPTLYPLACFFLSPKNYRSEVRDASFMFLESATHSYIMLSHLPSRIAAACVLLGIILVANNSNKFDKGYTLEYLWYNEILPFPGGISLDEIRPVALQLLTFTQKLCSASSRLQAIRRKYLSSMFHGVASLEFPSVNFFSNENVG